MKLITAVIRIDRLSAVRNGLESFGTQGMTVSEASGYGRQKGHKQFYRGATYTSDLVPKLRIDLVADEAEVERIIEIIIAAAQTGEPGDGKIWVSLVEDIIRVSDGQRGAEAL